jgi:YaiO family outer membrane protein
MRAVACALLALPLSTLAQTPQPPHWRAALVTEHSSLDKGQSDWDAVSLQLGRHWSKRQLAEVELTETRRFGLRDTEFALGGAMPLGAALTASVRVTHSPTHRVLPRASMGGNLQYEFRPAWLLHGGLKTTRYGNTDVDQASVMLEHYFGNWSALGALHAIRAFGQHTQAAELRGSYYYGDASSVGAIASSGEEVTATGPGTQVLARVRSLALVGRHAFDARWSLRYGLHRVRQGDFYTRSGVTLGVQADF